jgi:hypothetical protein
MLRRAHANTQTAIAAAAAAARCAALVSRRFRHAASLQKMTENRRCLSAHVQPPGFMLGKWSIISGSAL